MAETLSELGEYRSPIPPPRAIERRIARNRNMLARVLNTPAMVAVAGAGISAHRGYPTWSRFVEELLEETERILTERSHPRSREWSGLRQRYQRGEYESPEARAFLLGGCREVLDGLVPVTPTDDSSFGGYLRRRFGPRSPALTDAPDLVQDLVALGIRRFATTNYDVEIERSLALPHALDLTGICAAGMSGARLRSEQERVCSLTQMGAHQSAQMIFVLSRVPWSRDMVFHLHGRFDHPDSIVATEADYQRWYLGTALEGAIFRQTVEVLFRSNPILFVGYSLGDEDLLRQLRTFCVCEPERKHSRPLFALLPLPDPAQWPFVLQHYYDRYGIHVIPYEGSGDGSGDAWANSLHQALLELGELRQTWRAGWLAKPMIRSVRLDALSVKASHYVHHRLRYQGERQLGEERLIWARAELVRQCERHRCVVVLGRGGTGKSFTVLDFLDRGDLGAYEGAFFWSSYYTDDALTGLDRALEFMRSRLGQAPASPSDASRFDLLRRYLAAGRFLLVFDGFERLLARRQNDPPEVGSAAVAGVSRFFEALKDLPAECHSTVVLTSRLWPADLGPLESGQHGLMRLRRLRAEDLRPLPQFAVLSDARVGELCSLLEGHVYGLLLAGRYVDLSPDKDAAAEDLTLKLSQRTEIRRNSLMIRLLVDRLVEHHGPLVQELLERLAQFMSPVSVDVVRTLLQDCPHGSGRHAGEALRILVDNHLVFEVEQRETEVPGATYTTHPTVRGFVYYAQHGSTGTAMPNFTLPGFTSGTADQNPGPIGSPSEVTRLIDILHDEAVRALESGDGGRAVDHSRACFGVLRSRSESLTAARFGSIEAQMLRALKVANLVRRVSPGTWRFSAVLDGISDVHAPLFADELAWLYNDIGLAACAEGSMPDAIAIWDQGYQINRAIEAATGQYVVQSLLHLGHTYLEVGHLGIASQYLERTERANQRLRSKDYQARITGYQGLVAHLQGDQAAAERLYRDCLKLLRTEVPNARAEAWFRFHFSNLLVAQNKLDEAWENLTTAHGIAESHDFPELAGHVRGGFGRLERGRGRLESAQREYDATLVIARRCGIRRLEADAFSELARIALERCDFGTAVRHGLESLALANELGLGLRQTHSLVIMGLAICGMGHKEQGRHYLHHAKALAHVQQYGSREREVDQHIAQLS